MSFRILVLAAAVVSLLAGGPGRADTFQRGIVYSQSGLRLNLCRPDAEAARRTMVIMVHGGSFRTGRRDQMNGNCRRLAQNGFTAATVSYRLTSQGYAWPAPVDDVATAVAWARANAGAYGVDPDRIVLLGYSAGGTLALSAGLASGAGVAGIVDIAGVPDLELGLAETPYANLRRDVRAYVGPNDPATASPLRLVSRGDPPVLILHGTADGIVRIRQSERLAARLGAAGVPYRFVPLQGGGHDMVIRRRYVDVILRETLAFLQGIDAR